MYQYFDDNTTLETRGAFLDMSKAFEKVWHGEVFLDMSKASTE